MVRDAGVVLAAGGAGERFGGRKQFLALAGRSVLHYSLDVFCEIDEVTSIVVVVPPDFEDEGQRTLDSWVREREGDQKGVRDTLGLAIVLGGARRQDSVVAGLRYLAERTPRVSRVLVHDAVRPLLTVDSACRVLHAVSAREGAVLGTPVTDSVKRVRDNRVVEALPREEIWTVQTPQGAALEVLLNAYLRQSSTLFTDEASALQAAGIPVVPVQGSTSNLKITVREDLPLIERTLEYRRLDASRALGGATP